MNDDLWPWFSQRQWFVTEQISSKQSMWLNEIFTWYSFMGTVSVRWMPSLGDPVEVASPKVHQSLLASFVCEPGHSLSFHNTYQFCQTSYLHIRISRVKVEYCWSPHRCCLLTTSYHSAWLSTTSLSTQEATWCSFGSHIPFPYASAKLQY